MSPTSPYYSLDHLFTAFAHAIAGGPALALLASLVWGTLSVVLSPCHLTSIPLIVGYIAGAGNLTTRRAFTLSAFFAVGILVSIALVGAFTAAIGRMAGDVGPWGTYVVAGIFFIVGLSLLDVVPLTFAAPVGVKRWGSGPLSAFLIGLVFGIALGPCTFAYLAPVLAVAFRSAWSAPWYAAALLLAYGIGHAGIIALAGGSTELVQHFLRWQDSSRAVHILKYTCGVLVILSGLYMIYRVS